jgi:hypothetical protein
MKRLVRNHGSLGLFSFLLLVSNGCGGRAVNNSQARDILLGARADMLTKGDVQVIGITQLGPQDAVVEIQLHSAFRLRKVDGDWVVREVRIGRGQWENLDDLMRALQRIKIEETQSSLEKIAAAIEAYRRKNSRLPDCKNYVELADALYPLFLSPLIREDAWKQPLVAAFSPLSTIRLISSGPDGKLGTPDDIELVRIF